MKGQTLVADPAAAQQQQQLQAGSGSSEKTSSAGGKKEEREDTPQDGILPAAEQLSIPTVLDGSTEELTHQEPAGECLVCFDILEPRNYAEYALHTRSCSSQQNNESSSSSETVKDGVKSDATVNSKNTGTTALTRDIQAKENISSDVSKTTWHPARFCTACIEELRAIQFKRYCDSVANSICEREQRALLARGPPINLRDRLAFPESNDQEIYSLWYAADKQMRPAKLKDSLEGEERQELWSRLQQFLIENEEASDEGDGKRTENS